MAAACSLGPALVSKVEISVSCRKLADKDITSKSDPVCLLFMCPPGAKDYEEVDRTEMLKDTLNPDFQHKFLVDFHFEEHQKMKLQLYDIDSKSKKLKRHDFLGQYETSLGELVRKRRFEAPLEKSPKRGSTIILTCLEFEHCKEKLSVSVSGQELSKKKLLGNSDPYFEIYKPVNPVVDTSPTELARTEWTVVYRSEVIKKSSNFKWQPLTLKLSQLCNGNKDLVLKFQCMNKNKKMKDSLIGSFYASLNQLLAEHSSDKHSSHKHSSHKPAERTLMDKKNKSAGKLVFERMQLEVEESFIDYIQGGCELCFTVAIDFTESNGHPDSPASLHYIDPNGGHNQYEVAIEAVGEILQDYNSSKTFAAFGFGARVGPEKIIKQKFALSLNESHPYCHGVVDLLQAYRNCLRSVRLYGPTDFAPVINQVMQLAKANQTGTQFHVLLIITDGNISDFHKTKLSIIEASKLPMSIIIVGVGQEDFKSMEELDADNKRLEADGRIAEADIVQFVPLRDFCKENSIVDSAKSALAKSVLEELPDQLLCWMRKRGIKSRPTTGRVVASAPLDDGQPLPGDEAPYPQSNLPYTTMPGAALSPPVKSSSSSC